MPGISVFNVLQELYAVLLRKRTDRNLNGTLWPDTRIYIPIRADPIGALLSLELLLATNVFKCKDSPCSSSRTTFLISCKIGRRRLRTQNAYFI